MSTLHRARICGGCSLRFPVPADTALGARCPRCGQATELASPPFDVAVVPRGSDDRSGPRLDGLLDNVRSLRNVGSIARTADGCGLGQLWLCGITAGLDHPGLAKTALGAERAVPWRWCPDAVACADELIGRGAGLWALEGGPRSEDLFELVRTGAPGPERWIVLVVGHEVAGIEPALLERCERVVSLPMCGVKSSLNVSVAFGIAAYALRFGGVRASGPAQRRDGQ